MPTDRNSDPYIDVIDEAYLVEVAQCPLPICHHVGALPRYDFGGRIMASASVFGSA
jgi:hypothetical protein